MSGLHLTRHAILRMSQRGVGLDDIEIVESIGTEVEGGYLVRRKDVQAFEQQLKKLGDWARRLEGKRVVVKNNIVVTTYHARQTKQRHCSAVN
jgi:hypothetical protein